MLGKMAPKYRDGIRPLRDALEDSRTDLCRTHSTGSDDAQDWLISEVNDGVVNVVNLRSGSLMCAEGQLENGTAVSGYNVVATAPVAGWKISNENDTGGISTK